MSSDGNNHPEGQEQLNNEEFVEAQFLVDLNMPLREKPLFELYPNILKIKEAVHAIFLFLICRGKKEWCKKRKKSHQNNKEVMHGETEVAD